jgi:hypothetical protein
MVTYQVYQGADGDDEIIILARTYPGKASKARRRAVMKEVQRVNEKLVAEKPDAHTQSYVTAISW